MNMLDRILLDDGEIQLSDSVNLIFSHNFDPLYFEFKRLEEANKAYFIAEEGFSVTPKPVDKHLVEELNELLSKMSFSFKNVINRKLLRALKENKELPDWARESISYLKFYNLKPEDITQNFSIEVPASPFLVQSGKLVEAREKISEISVKQDYKYDETEIHPFSRRIVSQFSECKKNGYSWISGSEARMFNLAKEIIKKGFLEREATILYYPSDPSCQFEVDAPLEALNDYDLQFIVVCDGVSRPRFNQVQVPRDNKNLKIV